MKNTQALTQNLQTTLVNYQKFFPLENHRFSLLEEQISQNENIWTRKNFRGHMTASAYIFDKNFRKFCVIFHNKLAKWLVPGGHFEAENDENLLETAKREVMEEVGISQIFLAPWHEKNDFLPIDIDTHFIPANPKKDEPEHFHHDFRYVFVTDLDEKIALQTEEVSDFQWISVDEIPENLAKETVIEKIQKYILQK